MMRALLRSVIRNATVTHADSGSLRLDPLLMHAAELLPLEQVDVLNLATGARITTFVEAGEEGSGAVDVHGIARVGDAIAVLSWGYLHEGQTLAHCAKVVEVDARNRVIAVVDR